MIVETLTTRGRNQTICRARVAYRILASRRTFRSSSDSISFSKNESESSKSARTDS
jgi:hypothetical protein